MATIKQLWRDKDFISSRWESRGVLGDCPKCTIPLIAIIDTKKETYYYHAKTIVCWVKK